MPASVLVSVLVSVPVSVPFAMPGFRPVSESVTPPMRGCSDTILVLKRMWFHKLYVVAKTPSQARTSVWDGNRRGS